jgi:hypothetical protein
MMQTFFWILNGGRKYPVSMFALTIESRAEESLDRHLVLVSHTSREGLSWQLPQLQVVTVDTAKAGTGRHNARIITTAATIPVYIIDLIFMLKPS